MEIFLNNIVAFPVVVYTFLLFIILCYWALALIGVVDIEMLELDFDVDVDLDVDAGADFEGVGGIAGFILNWGLTGVPVTVVVTIMTATSWLICYLLVSIVFPFVPFELIRIALGIVFLVGSLGLSIVATARIIRPMRNMFASHSAVRKSTLIGKVCEVKTLKVTADFGQGELNDGEAGMLLDIRSAEPNSIAKGDMVVLIEYIEKEGAYFVAPSTY